MVVRGSSEDRSEAILAIEEGQTRLPYGLGCEKGALHEHQARAIDALTAWMRGTDRRGILCLPTGAGKTRTTVQFLCEHVLRDAPDARILWLSDRVELLEQAIDCALKNAHQAQRRLEFGRYGAGATKASRAVDMLFASNATVIKARKTFFARHPRFDFVVYDECHHAVAKTRMEFLKDALGRRSETRLLGLTASPFRRDKGEDEELWELFQAERPICDVPAVTLIKQKVLAEPSLVLHDTGRAFFAPSVFGSEDLVDISPEDVKRIERDEERNKFALKLLCEGAAKFGPTVVFVATVEAAEYLRDELGERGEGHGRAVVIHSKLPRKERKAALDAFKDGHAQFIINVTILTEGADLPKVETVVIVRPTRSPALFQQMIGRGMRGPKVGGTERCRIVVLADRLIDLGKPLAGGWERTTWASLGLGRNVKEQPREMPPSDPARDAALDALRRACREVLRVRDSDADPRDLIGYWAIARAYLPVFDGELRLLGEWITRLARASNKRRHPPLPQCDLLDQSFLQKFERTARVAIARGEEPRFVLLGYAPADELVQVEASVRAEMTDVSAHEHRAPRVSSPPRTPADGLQASKGKDDAKRAQRRKRDAMSSVLAGRSGSGFLEKIVLDEPIESQRLAQKQPVRTRALGRVLPIESGVGSASKPRDVIRLRAALHSTSARERRRAQAALGLEIEPKRWARVKPGKKPARGGTAGKRVFRSK